MVSIFYASLIGVMVSFACAHTPSAQDGAVARLPGITVGEASRPVAFGSVLKEIVSELSLEDGEAALGITTLVEDHIHSFGSGIGPGMKPWPGVPTEPIAASKPMSLQRFGAGVTLGNKLQRFGSGSGSGLPVESTTFGTGGGTGLPAEMTTFGSGTGFGLMVESTITSSSGSLTSFGSGTGPGMQEQLSERKVPGSMLQSFGSGGGPGLPVETVTAGISVSDRRIRGFGAGGGPGIDDSFAADSAVAQEAGAFEDMIAIQPVRKIQLLVMLLGVVVVLINTACAHRKADRSRQRALAMSCDPLSYAFKARQMDHQRMALVSLPPPPRTTLVAV